MAEFTRFLSGAEGYLDRVGPAEDIARNEIREEAGIEGGYSLSAGIPHEVYDSDIGKTWLIFPFVAEFNEKPKLRLDWENTEARWINMKDLSKFNFVPFLNITLENALSSISL